MSIKEIAKMTGSSPATVSRVLNNPDYKCKDDKLRDKIWKAAMKLNYVPNEAARNLKKGKAANDRTYYINVLVTRADDSRSDPFFRELLNSIESELHKNFCLVSNIWYKSIFSNERRKDGIDTVINDMKNCVADRNDGLIIIGKCNKEALKKLKSKFKNIVSVNRNSTNYEVDEVLLDGKKIAEIALEYLISLGHESIAYVGECRNEARYDGYLDVLRKNDIDIIPEYIYETPQTELSGFELMKKILLQDERPTAFYCANDISAVGMLKCLYVSRNRYYIPSVIASDNIEEGQFTSPMLTTVNVPKNEMGKFTVWLLLDRIKGGHTNTIRLEIEGNLIKRSSCSPVGEVNVSEYYI